MIDLLDEEHIENIFNCTIDEETVETIRVLFNYGINYNLFNTVISLLKEQTNNIDNYNESNQDIILEIIDIIESNSR